jgi:hypothetical protein
MSRTLGTQQSSAKDHLTMDSVFRGALAFAELLSCGFATIGVRATLTAIALQLVDDTLVTLTGRRLSTTEV